MNKDIQYYAKCMEALTKWEVIQLLIIIKKVTHSQEEAWFESCPSKVRAILVFLGFEVEFDKKKGYCVTVDEYLQV